MNESRACTCRDKSEGGHRPTGPWVHVSSSGVFPEQPQLRPITSTCPFPLCPPSHHASKGETRGHPSREAPGLLVPLKAVHCLIALLFGAVCEQTGFGSSQASLAENWHFSQRELKRQSTELPPLPAAQKPPPPSSPSPTGWLSHLQDIDRGRERWHGALYTQTHERVCWEGLVCWDEQMLLPACLGLSAACFPARGGACFFFMSKSCFGIGNTCRWCFNSRYRCHYS